MIEAYVIIIWLAISLLAGGSMYEWQGDEKEAALMFLLWPYYALLAVVAGSLVLMAWACLRIHYWTGGK